MRNRSLKQFGWGEGDSMFNTHLVLRYIRRNQKTLNIDAAEKSLLDFIIDRTLDWGKGSEYITMNQFTKGLTDQDGVSWTEGLKMTKNTVLAKIKSLVDKKLILVFRLISGGVEKVYYSISDDLMKVPKRLKNTSDKRGAKIEQGGAKFAPKTKKDNNTNINTNNLERAEAPSHSDSDNIQEELLTSLSEVTTRAKAVRERKKSAGERMNSGLVPSLSAMKKIWQDLHKDHFKDQPMEAASDGLFHSVRKYARDWNKRHAKQELCFVRDFLPTLFENWNAIVRFKLDWMTNKPLAPSVRILASAKLRSFVESAYQNRERMISWSKMSPFDREVDELVTLKGFDKQSAIEEATRKAKQRGDIIDLKKERKSLERRRELLDEKQRQYITGAAKAERSRARRESTKEIYFKDAPERLQEEFEHTEELRLKALEEERAKRKQNDPTSEMTEDERDAYYQRQEDEVEAKRLADLDAMENLLKN